MELTEMEMAALPTNQAVVSGRSVKTGNYLLRLQFCGVEEGLEDDCALKSLGLVHPACP
jgi:hypothetical protein